MSTLVPFCKGSKFAPYFPIPLYIIRSGLPWTAILVYGFMLSRIIGSSENPLFHDKNGVFIYASIDEMAEDLGRGRTAIHDAVNRLVESGFIVKKRMGLNHSNKYYVMIPSDNRKNERPDNRKSGNPDD